MVKSCCVMCLCLILLHIFLRFVPIQSAPESAIVTQIPGFSGTLPSKHYAGYFFFLCLLNCFPFEKFSEVALFWVVEGM